MEISKEDFNMAIRIANKAGQRGKEISIKYIPSTSATERNGTFVTYEYQLTAAGG